MPKSESKPIEIDFPNRYTLSEVRFPSLHDRIRSREEAEHESIPDVRR